MIDIIVTGGNGQLGKSLRRISDDFKDMAFTFIDIDDLDLTDQNAVTHFFKKHSFKYIINCAAYTAVDLAEKEAEKAHLINATVPELLGHVCINQPSYLIHLSTDYVYNGSIGKPHLEDDVPLPLSVYAQSKLEGEKILWQNPKAIVIRTSWLYSEYGNNFVKTILKLAKEKTELNVVYDQVGTPTYAGDLANTIMKIIHFSENNSFSPGIYNYANHGVCSWYDFAMAILALTDHSCKIHPVRSNEFPQAAQRPEFSVMDKRKIEHIFSLDIPYWRDSLRVALNNMKIQTI